MKKAISCHECGGIMKLESINLANIKSNYEFQKQYFYKCMNCAKIEDIEDRRKDITKQ